MSRPPFSTTLLLTLALLLGNAGAAADGATPVQHLAQAETGRAPTTQHADGDAETKLQLLLMNRRVVLLHEQGRYGEAERLARHTAALATHVLGEDHPITLDSTTNLASVHVELENFGEAERLLLRTLPALEEIFGKTKPEALLPALNSLASLYGLQGAFGKAEQHYLRALLICEEVLGSNHLTTLTALGNLASVYRAQDRHEDAEPLYLRALRASEATRGERDRATLALANNLAGLYQDLKRYDEAEDLFETTLRRTRAEFGEDHPDTLGSLNNLALLYFDQGRFEEAEPLLRTVLQKARVIFGESHSAVLKTENSLATLFRHTDRFAEAEALFTATLVKSEAALGSSHPLTMTVMRNLIGLYFVIEEPGQILAPLQRLEGAAFAYTDDELPNTSGEAQKRRLLARQRVMQDLALNLALRYPTASHLQFAATVVFRWSQVQGEHLAFLQRLSRRSDDPQVRSLATDIQTVRTALGGLANEGNPHPGQLQAALDELANLEIQLGQRSRVYRRHLAIRDLDFDDVRRALPKNAGLLVATTY
ncbi:MAG: tetratricopeptide repeat protein, partial [Boseongicola sp.]|nr:tetratricopeptide repeat protein [Boseongicola sp.]